MQKSLESIQKTYSQEAKNLVLYLSSKPSEIKSISDVLVMISPKLVDYIAQIHSYADTLEGQLQLALENGRVARLLMKLGFINERNDASETGDAYIVKLFRDHVFHQVDSEGKPLIDLAHVLYNLNKVSLL